MNTLLAQIDIPVLSGNWKLFLLGIAGLLLSMIVGRFVQAFRGGAGLIDAGKAVLFGTNVSPLVVSDIKNTSAAVNDINKKGPNPDAVLTVNNEQPKTP
jgi:hypothetical protein